MGVLVGTAAPHEAVGLNCFCGEIFWRRGFLKIINDLCRGCDELAVEISRFVHEL